ncbi:hypothetical protein Sjap_017735 [Stephania japonica]|uniref:Uncharacterized protein n=1 Tax=Stephania japonica TaxID=461633 RepID=A0AAP0NKS1_9MAGN
MNDVLKDPLKVKRKGKPRENKLKSDGKPRKSKGMRETPGEQSQKGTQPQKSKGKRKQLLNNRQQRKQGQGRAMLLGSNQKMSKGLWRGLSMARMTLKTPSSPVGGTSTMHYSACAMDIEVGDSVPPMDSQQSWTFTTEDILGLELFESLLRSLVEEHTKQ